MKTIPLLAAAALCLPALAEEVAIKAERAMVITFPSKTQRAYKMLAAEAPGGPWTMVQDGIAGTGGEVTIFYKSQSDQKLFFKVETSAGPAGQRSLLSLANLDISHKDLTGYNLEGHDLRGYNFRGSKLDEADLLAADISEANLGEASLQRADLRHAIARHSNLEGANFFGADLEGAQFVGAYAGFADFRNARLNGVRFDGTVLRGANFAGQTLANVSFRAAGSKWVGDTSRGLAEVNFAGASLVGADLSRNWADSIVLVGANIAGVNFEGSSLNGVSMKGRDLRSLLMRGVAVYSGDWSGINASGTDFSLASFGPEILLTDANFEGANLEGVRIGVGSTPFGARPILSNLNFRNANLRGAFLEGITFQNCDFTAADLSFANAIAASFPGCTGLDPEQPGMQFGPGQPLGSEPPNPPGTILPDGTARVGTNPGTPLAPAAIPPRLLLSIDDAEHNEQLDLSFSGTTFTHGTQQGTVEYQSQGHVAKMVLHYSSPVSRAVYVLLFTSPAGGHLYKTGAGNYLVGTFSVPE